jgi:hypothetical protein
MKARKLPIEPLIKSHPARLDISSKFSQLSQHASIGDQWLTAKNPTVTARQRWQIDASEAPGVRVTGPLHRVTYYRRSTVFLPTASARHSIIESDVNHAITLSLMHMNGTRNRIANKSTTFCCSVCTQNKFRFVLPESVDLIFAHDSVARFADHHFAPSRGDCE